MAPVEFRDLNHLTTIASSWLRPIVAAAIFPAGHP